MSQQDAGTRFPFINLEKALGRAEQMFRADEHGRPMAVPTLYEVWGYSSKSSGGHQTVAALKAYGLLDDSGNNADRKIFLTDGAKRYFKDEREHERQRLLKEFSLRPKLLAALWQDWHGSPPADNIARSHLKLDRKLNEQSARSILGIYKDNVAFANLKGSDMPTAKEDNDPMVEPDTFERNKQDDDAPPLTGKAPKVSLDGDQLTIQASIPLKELPTLLKKLKALEAFYEAG